LVYLSILLFPNSYIISFWEFYFLRFCVHAQTNIIYLILGWREINQQDAINPIFIIKLLSQQVSGIIMPIISGSRLCISVYGFLPHTTTASTTSAEHHAQ
jgi:hypothetical protein